MHLTYRRSRLLHILAALDQQVAHVETELLGPLTSKDATSLITQASYLLGARGMIEQQLRECDKALSSAGE